MYTSFLRFLFTLSLSISLLITSTTTLFAKTPYLGIQLGWGDVHQGDYVSKRFRGMVNNIFTDNNLRDYTILFNNTGLAGRIFTGYQFNPYFALELGYSRFANLHVRTSFRAKLATIEDYSLWGAINLDAKAQTYVIDLLAKLIWPINDSIDVYTKLGVAYLETKSNLKLILSAYIGSIIIKNNPAINLVYPAFALGVSYHFNEHVAADFSWEHIHRYNANFFPNIDFVGVGMMYYF